MSRGHGKLERRILEYLEAWAKFPLMDLRPNTRSQAEALKRAARNLERQGKISIDYDQARMVITKAPEDGHAVWVEGIVEAHPDTPPPKPGDRWVIKRADGKFDVVEFRQKLSRDLSRAEALRLFEALRLADRVSQGRAPEWGEREAELDKMHIEAPSVIRGWRSGEAEDKSDKALRKRAHRIVDDRKDHEETQKRLQQHRAFWEAYEADERRGQKRRKGLRPRGDEDAADDAEGEMLSDQGRHRTVDAVLKAAAGLDDVNRLIEEPAGTLETSEQDMQEQAEAEEAQAEQERLEATTQTEWKHEERERLASLEPPTPDPEYDEPDADEVPPDGTARS
jgi:hypothetical protein